MSGRVAIFGGRRWELAPGETSLSFDATRREVRRHRDGCSEIVGDDIWTVLGEQLAGGATAIGYLGYACRPDLPALSGGDRPGMPDAVLLLTHRPGRAVSSAEATRRRPAPPAPPEASEASRPPAWYADAFAAVQEALHAGETYETNLTYRIEVASTADPEEVFGRLCATSPAPYAGYLGHDVDGARVWLTGSSPERFALIEDGWIQTKPIKGTTPRAADTTEDAANAALLLTDPKLRSENLIVTDLLRNDLAICCAAGTVTVPRLMAVESYASVHQLVTTVHGRLSPGVTPTAAVRALFPPGSMTGAPKLRTMELIGRVEPGPRGPYAGVFGTLSADAADLGVVIRTAVTAGDGRWQVGTGGGITVASGLEGEWAETWWKAERVLAALAAGEDVPVC
ncbi:MAG: anthranilate synthase component I family protein [Nocardioides sp.]|uniref:anthranilate synthase component I family protein n=1 Tax=Nocardioides sp. TaxID=35761 RepID=UPI0039E34B98